MPRYEVIDQIGIIVHADNREEAGRLARNCPSSDWYPKECTTPEVYELDDEPCEGCDGSGVRWDNNNGENLVVPCGMLASGVAWSPVERCDCCLRFASYLDAAKAMFETVIEVSIVGFESKVPLGHTRKAVSE